MTVLVAHKPSIILSIVVLSVLLPAGHAPPGKESIVEPDESLNASASPVLLRAPVYIPFADLSGTVSSSVLSRRKNEFGPIEPERRIDGEPSAETSVQPSNVMLWDVGLYISNHSLAGSVAVPIHAISLIKTEAKAA